MDLNEIGVTPRKEAQFKKRGIESVEDLLRCYPKEYRDYRVPVSVRTLKDRQDERAAVLGIVTGCRILQGKHAMVRLKDKDGGNISAVWFNQAFRVRQVVLGGSYIVGGTARWDEQYQSVSFLMPDLFESFEGFRFGIKPVYRKIPGMSEEYFSSVMEEALSHIDDMGDYLSDEECKELDIPSTADTFRLAHLPESMEDVERAQRRVLVDNMYPFCREMEMKRMQAAAESPFVPLAAFEAMEQIRAFLLYQLTEDQKNALRRMLHEMKTGKRLDVLLQGDVGCGKTIVAIILAACMCKSGYQTAVVCPTSVLAGQHLQAFQSLLGKLDIKVAYLQGGMKAAERKALLKEIKSGAAGVVIGTHALFSPDVEFKALGLMIIDEEHRFGVKQKEALRKKAAQGVHSVSMSATPIPRSIAVAMYGEGTEVVNIRTLPNGRKPVKTILYSNEEKVYQSMMNQISAGHMTKCFSRKNFPRDTPRLAVGYLADEGALKAAAANVLDAKHHPIIAIGGVSCYGQWEETCRYLQSKNIHFVADAFDSDRETNASVQKSLEKLYSIAAQYGIRMQRCDWGTAQKGVDDFLLGAAVQTDDGVILSSLWDPRNFVPPVRYIKKNIPAMFKPPVYKPKHTA